MNRLFQSNATLRAFSTANAAVDEEQVRQRRVAEDTDERVDEPRHRNAVDIGIARLVHRRRGQFGEKLVLRQGGWFMPSADEAKNVNISR